MVRVMKQCNTFPREVVDALEMFNVRLDGQSDRVGDVPAYCRGNGLKLPLKSFLTHDILLFLQENYRREFFVGSWWCTHTSPESYGLYSVTFSGKAMERPRRTYTKNVMFVMCYICLWLWRELDIAELFLGGCKFCSGNCQHETAVTWVWQVSISKPPRKRWL